MATALDAYDRLARTTADADAILTEGGTAGVDVLRKLDELGDADLEEAGEFLARSDVDTADAVGLLDDLPDGFVERLGATLAETPSSLQADLINGIDGFVDWRDYKSLDDVARQGDQTILRGVINGNDGGDIVTNARYFDDGQEYVNEILGNNQDAVRQGFEDNGAGDLYDGDPVDAINRLDELDGTGTASNIRGDIAEDTLMPVLERQKYGAGSYDTDAGELSDGYIPQDDIPFKMDSEQTGFDGMAVNDDGDLVIIETKANSNSDRLVASDLGDTNAGRQLSDGWIEEKFREWGTDPTSKQRAFLETLKEERYLFVDERKGKIESIEINRKNLQTEFVDYQDGSISSEFASGTLRKTNTEGPSVDKVEVIKTGDIFPAP